MVLGITLSTFTLVHVLISLAGIGSGFIVVYGLLTAKRLDGWTAAFLTTTILTSVTGFLFPVEHLLPSHIIGTISLVVLAVALLARYARHMEGSWRWIYVVSAVVALYFNVFVAVVQSFLKIPAVHALGADAEGTAVCCGSAHRDGDFCGDRHFRGEEFPHRAHRRSRAGSVEKYESVLKAGSIPYAWVGNFCCTGAAMTWQSTDQSTFLQLVK